MAITRVSLAVPALNGWKIEGILGGAGPLASVIFRNDAGEEQPVGIDLDKAILLGEPPVPVDQESLCAIANAMNERRRRLLFESGSVAPPSR